MKCQKCGFISRRNYDRCPYCGSKLEQENNRLKRTVKIGRLFEIKTKTLIYLLMVNILALAFVADYFLNFKYNLGLAVFLILVLFILIFEALQIKKSPIMFAEKVDFWITLSLILCCFFLRVEGVFDVRKYVIAYVLPAYVLISTTILFVMLLFLGTKKIKPLWTGALIFYHLAIGLTLLIFVLVCKARFIHGYNATDIIPYVIMCEQGSPLGLPYLIEELLVVISFGVTTLYFFNFNFILFGHIFREVRSTYGKRD